MLRTPGSPSPERSPAAALTTLRARAFFSFGRAESLLRCREKRPSGYLSRCLEARKAAILGFPPLVAPALSPRLRLGPRLAPQEAGRPTLCGGSAARPRVAPTFCRVFPAGPAYGNCRVKSPLSPASLRAVSESSSATHRSAWSSAIGTSRLGTCPSSQVWATGWGRGSLGGR